MRLFVPDRDCDIGYEERAKRLDGKVRWSREGYAQPFRPYGRLWMAGQEIENAGYDLLRHFCLRVVACSFYQE